MISIYLSLKLPFGIIAVATSIFFGICAAVFLPAYTAALFSPKVGKTAAKASMVAGLTASVLWMAFSHAKEAHALGLTRILFGRETLLGFPWIVIVPIVIALPISTLTLFAVHWLCSIINERTTVTAKGIITERN
ncbi:MAG: hypothetical protein Q7J85_03855 [Bacillota bacterium]|nr:hypothetical protein [Bacillota bacterium]